MLLPESWTFPIKKKRENLINIRTNIIHSYVRAWILSVKIPFRQNRIIYLKCSSKLTTWITNSNYATASARLETCNCKVDPLEIEMLVKFHSINLL